MDRTGRIDVLVNNAGVLHRGVAEETTTNIGPAASESAGAIPDYTHTRRAAHRTLRERLDQGGEQRLVDRPRSPRWTSTSSATPRHA